MAPGTGTFPSLINPEAARLLDLVRSPQKDRGFKRKVPGRSQVAAKTNLPAAEPTWQRLPPRLGLPRFFPGLAEVLESHQPKGTAESKVWSSVGEVSDFFLSEPHPTHPTPNFQPEVIFFVAASSSASTTAMPPVPLDTGDENASSECERVKAVWANPQLHLQALRWTCLIPSRAATQVPTQSGAWILSSDISLVM
eukprot:symbB.v1.2.019154.t1/scaffold1555.1/size186957/8